MDKLFGKKVDPKKEMKKQDRELRKSERDLLREDKVLERQQKQIELEIKKAAKLNQKDSCTTYAKQLIQVRKQRERIKVASSQLMGVRNQAMAMGANAALATTVAGATRAMQGMNNTMNPAELGKTLNEFKMASDKLGMSEELMNDALDDILNESGDEEESQNILDKVLDEIGIEIKGKLSQAPQVSGETPGSSSKIEDDIEKQLARLKAI